jgi:hypothetical protein
MGLWYRIFGSRPEAPAPGAVLAHLNGPGLGAGVTGHFRGDDRGWFHAEIAFGPGTPLHLERWLADEEGIRAELNNWAAYLETCDYSPAAAPLMERMIQTAQLFTLRRPLDAADEVLVERLCVALCQLLARETDGVYQADDQGFFAADGTLLVQEY